MQHGIHLSLREVQLGVEILSRAALTSYCEMQVAGPQAAEMEENAHLFIQSGVGLAIQVLAYPVFSLKNRGFRWPVLA